MITLYGISNCDSVKKARRWLDSQSVAYRFHDYRKDGLQRAWLAGWCDELGWQQLLNKRSTSWRQLPEASKQAIDQDKAIELMLALPTLIKRPLLDLGSCRKLGFDANNYQTYFPNG